MDKSIGCVAHNTAQSEGRTTIQVRDVMTRKVISVTVDISILAAARLMLQNRISGLPVVDAGGRLVGVVTEGDFLRRGELGTQRSRPAWLNSCSQPAGCQ